MWDKEYKFLLVTQKAMVPAQAVIDDNDLFGNIDDELGGDGGEEGTEQRGRHTALAREEDNLTSVLKEMNKHNEVANLTSVPMLQDG
jgi:hypothetical protein